MRTCPDCGKSCANDAKYCSYCGIPFDNWGIKRESEEIVVKSRKQEREKRCPFCQNTGRLDMPMRGEITVTCPVCRGRRYNLIPEDWLGCKECGGTGEFSFGFGLAYTRKPCPECKGTAWTPE
jgi:DnaJ-class molecular chaperone